VGFIEEFKRAYAGDETHHYSVDGTQVICGHCGGLDFDRGRALLNTKGLTFLQLDWANREANLLICTSCSEIRWFLAEPERI
jgi:hypothetical protein